MKNYCFLCILLILSYACHRNRLKNDETALAKDILTEEEQQEKERREHEEQLAGSLANRAKGFRFPEERNADPQKSLLVIDVAGSLNHTKKVTLSNVASYIRYVRMETIPDSSLEKDMKFRYYLMDDYIVAANLFGIHLFSKEGKYLRTVVKNNYTGLNYDKKNNRVIARSDMTRVGGETSVWARGNRLYYPYTNNITGQQFIMEYDCYGNQDISAGIAFDPENPDLITGLGNVLIDLNHGKTIAPSHHETNGMWSTTPESMFQELPVFSPDKNTYTKQLRGQNMLGIFNSQGDTLVTFAKPEQVKNYKKSVMRGTDGGNQYEKGGNLFIRTDFNDTVFQVIPPNKLLPVYVFHLGAYKLTKQEGVDPGFDLNGKIILQNFADVRNYLFFTFTKDSYDCPDTRKNKTLKLYRALFSKADHQTIIVAGDPKDYDAPVLQNDIDGGVPVWPASYIIGKNGEILVSLKGADLKKQIQSNDFLTSTAPRGKKERLKQLASSVKKEDDILMIVK